MQRKGNVFLWNKQLLKMRMFQTQMHSKKEGVVGWIVSLRKFMSTRHLRITFLGNRIFVDVIS